MTCDETRGASTSALSVIRDRDLLWPSSASASRVLRRPFSSYHEQERLVSATAKWVSSRIFLTAGACGQGDRGFGARCTRATGRIPLRFGNACYTRCVHALHLSAYTHPLIHSIVARHLSNLSISAAPPSYIQQHAYGGQASSSHSPHFPVSSEYAAELNHMASPSIPAYDGGYWEATRNDAVKYLGEQGLSVCSAPEVVYVI